MQGVDCVVDLYRMVSVREQRPSIHHNIDKSDVPNDVCEIRQLSQISNQLSPVCDVMPVEEC